MASRPKENSPEDRDIAARVTDIPDVWLFMLALQAAPTYAQKDAGEIAGYLHEAAEMSSGGALVMLFGFILFSSLIEGCQPWLNDALRDAMPEFPNGMLEYIYSYQRATHGQAVLPSFELEDVDFAIEHIDVHRGSTYPSPLPWAKPQDLGIGIREARRIPISTWYRWRGGLGTDPDVPIIVIVGDVDQDLPARLTQLYSEQGQRRYHRLNRLPHWVYADLYFEFTRWDEVWEATRTDMVALREQVYGDKPALPILEQTRALHRYMELVVDRRECLRMHIASVKRYKAGVEGLNVADDREVGRDLKELVERLEIVQESLEHHQVTSETSIKQMENLLSLAFNTETVSQGLDVKKLNYLALVFLPLTFMSGIFGMTQFTIRAKWYPAFAFPLLVVTAIIAFLVGKGLSWKERFRIARVRFHNASAGGDEETGTLPHANRPPPPDSPPPSQSKSRKRPPVIVETQHGEKTPTGGTDEGKDSPAMHHSRNGSLVPPTHSPSRNREGHRRSDTRDRRVQGNGPAIRDISPVRSYSPPPSNSRLSELMSAQQQQLQARTSARVYNMYGVQTARPSKFLGASSMNPTSRTSHAHRAPNYFPSHGPPPPPGPSPSGGPSQPPPPPPAPTAMPNPRMESVVEEIVVGAAAHETLTPGLTEPPPQRVEPVGFHRPIRGAARRQPRQRQEPSQGYNARPLRRESSRSYRQRAGTSWPAATPTAGERIVRGNSNILRPVSLDTYR
ncbi:MAG: hypothetical protein M1839_002971 [Geoglossum umbratile]|nr:MAG: hypothetical protein M1839_002971 [Geoglossum umbratile]